MIIFKKYVTLLNKLKFKNLILANDILKKSIYKYLIFIYPNFYIKYNIDIDNDINIIIQNDSFINVNIKNLDSIINTILTDNHGVKIVFDMINSKKHLLPKLKDYIIKIKTIINNFIALEIN